MPGVQEGLGSSWAHTDMWHRGAPQHLAEQSLKGSADLKPLWLVGACLVSFVIGRFLLKMQVGLGLIFEVFWGSLGPDVAFHYPLCKGNFTQNNQPTPTLPLHLKH